MAREHLVPDLALVSDARRTRETWSLLKEKLPVKVEARIMSDLYDAPAGRMLDILRTTDPTVETVLMIGHNPGLQDLALMLDGAGVSPMREAMTQKYPTGALAVIDFSASDWESTEPGSGRLVQFVTPRSIQ